jgi:hypothetical protein
VAGVAVDAARPDDTAIPARLVMKRCIYGVTSTACVELAAELWLHSFTVGEPSLPHHHLRWGARDRRGRAGRGYALLGEEQRRRAA